MNLGDPAYVQDLLARLSSTRPGFSFFDEADLRELGVGAGRYLARLRRRQLKEALRAVGEPVPFGAGQARLITLIVVAWVREHQNKTI